MHRRPQQPTCSSSDLLPVSSLSCAVDLSPVVANRKRARLGKMAVPSLRAWGWEVDTGEARVSCCKCRMLRVAWTYICTRAADKLLRVIDAQVLPKVLAHEGEPCSPLTCPAAARAHLRSRPMNCWKSLKSRCCPRSWHMMSVSTAGQSVP